MTTLKKSFIVLMMLFFFVSLGWSADPVAVVVKSRGKVYLYHGTAKKPLQARKGQVLYGGDKLKTGAASGCALKFIDDKSLLRIKENSSCVIEGQREKEHINKNIVVEVGSFFASLFKQRGKFTVTTPTSVASVKGTKFWTIQLPDGRTVYIGLEGLVDLANDAGRVLLRSGQTATYSSRSQLPEIRLTSESEIPPLEEGYENMKSLEIEFQDANGNTKKLRIDYKENQ